MDAKNRLTLKQPSSHPTPPRARPASRNSFAARRRARASVFALACLLALAGCKDEPPPTTTVSGGTANANAPNANAAPGAATLCGAPHYPVREGLEKQYRVTYPARGAAAVSYTESYAAIRPDSFTLRYAFPDLDVDTGWNCTPEGMIALEYGKLDFARQPGGGNFKLETLSREGVTVPAAARWRVGETWSSRYEIRTTVGAGARDAEPGVGTGTIAITNRVVGEEAVKVPAGEFRALKVESALKMRLTVRVGRASVPTDMDMKNFSWFAEGVGMVKSESSGDMGGATTELVAFKR